MNQIKQFAFSEDTYGFLLGFTLMAIPLPYAFSSIALLLLLAVSLIHALFKPKTFQFAYSIPVILFVLMVVSLTWSVDVQKSMRGLERQLPFLLLPIAFWMMPKVTYTQFKKALSWFAYWMALFGAVMIFRAIVRSYSGKGNWVFSYHYLVDLFDLNAIYISVMTSLSLLFVFFYKPRKGWNLAAIFILAVFLFLLSSKNIIAITALCFVLGLLISNVQRVKKWWLLVIAVFGVGSIISYGPLKNRWKAEIETNVMEAWTAEAFSDIYPWTGTSFRVFQARIFNEMMQEDHKWLTGFGINAVQDKIAHKQTEYRLYCGYATYNFHNQYLQAFAEVGILGLLLVFGMLWVVIQIYWKHKEPFALFVFLLMAFVFLTETYIWRQRGMFHFLILYGILVSLFPMHKMESKPA